MPEIIAVRKLTLILKDGTKAEVSVGMSKPEYVVPTQGVAPGVGRWQCSFFVKEPNRDWSDVIIGLDALDAIKETVKFTDSILDNLKYVHKSRISWILASELPDGGPLRSDALYGYNSWQIPPIKKKMRTFFRWLKK